MAIHSRKTTLTSVNLLLTLLILIAANLVSSNSFFRIDMTSNDAYSLSPVSRESLALLADPLRVKVFYSDDVPAPYNSVRQYLLDLLREYDQAEDQHFTYELVDVTSEEGRQEAEEYGIRPVEIQEVRSDQFQSRNVYIGAAVLYGNVVERLNELTDTTGLEYRLTMAIRSAVTQVDTLAGATEPVEITLYSSPVLSTLGIDGFDGIESTVRGIYEELDEENFGQLNFEYQEVVGQADVDRLVERFGMNRISWENEEGVTREALLEVVLSYGDRFERIPVRILSTLFAGYRLESEESLAERISEGLRGLVSSSPVVAYATGHGEKSLDDRQQGSLVLQQLLDPRYRLEEVALGEEDIPEGVDTLIINGPRESYTLEALYRIDQFLLQGGSLMVFLDSHIQDIPSQQAMAQGARPSWSLNETGLSELLAHHGITVADELVLDEASFEANQGGIRQQIFQAPLLQGDSINRESVITRDLEDLILFNTAELRGEVLSEQQDLTVLLTSSDASWTVSDPEQIGPWIQGAPASGETGPRNLSVLLEGSFESYFDEPVPLEAVGEDPEAEGGDGLAIDQEGSFLTTGVSPGKILVVGSSTLTTSQLLDPQVRTPNGTFIFNALDYLNGTPGFAELRSKGLGVPRLARTSAPVRRAIRLVNTGVLPSLVVILGVLAWWRRKVRRRRIRRLFETEGVS
ncbi:MAG: Gldg family protein [Alkalispirochaetaceae bacterium]